MATVGQIRTWLWHVPDDAEFVVWGMDGEHQVERVGHSFPDAGETGVAGVWIAPTVIHLPPGAQVQELEEFKKPWTVRRRP